MSYDDEFLAAFQEGLHRSDCDDPKCGAMFPQQHVPECRNAARPAKKELTGLAGFITANEADTATYAGLTRSVDLWVPQPAYPPPVARYGSFSEAIRHEMTIIEQDLRRGFHESVWGNDWWLAERNPFPKFVPYPLIDRIGKRWRKVRFAAREVKWRFVKAGRCLRWGNEDGRYWDEDDD